MQETPLTAWISRGAGRRLAVKRVKGLNNAALQKVFARAKQDYGKPYDIYFLPDGKAIYCSELVKASFAAAGLTLGKLEKVGELASSSAMDSIIRDRWQNYPLCRGVKGMTLEKCRSIIMKQVLVTPASIARGCPSDPGLFQLPSGLTPPAGVNRPMTAAKTPSKYNISVLKLRNFRMLICTRICVMMALQAQSVIVGWQIYSMTKDTFLLGLTGLAEAIPRHFLRLFRGAYRRCGQAAPHLHARHRRPSRSTFTSSMPSRAGMWRLTGSTCCT